MSKKRNRRKLTADQKGQEEDRGLPHSGRRAASTHGRGNRQPAAEATSEYLRHPRPAASPSA